jgi:hypothetical protein
MDRLGRRAERERRAAAHGPGRGGALVVPRGGRRGRSDCWSRPARAPGPSGPPVESCVGVETEALLAFAGPHHPCSPLSGLLGALLEPQQAALGVACGLRAGPAPDRSSVGVATLTLWPGPPDRIQSGQVRRCGAGDRAFLLLREGACGGTKEEQPVPAPSAAVRRLPRVCGVQSSRASAGTTRTTSVRQSERMWSCRRRWLVRWRRGHAGGRFRTGQVATGAGAER